MNLKVLKEEEEDDDDDNNNNNNSLLRSNGLNSAALRDHCVICARRGDKTPSFPLEHLESHFWQYS